jgi:hypothetical protein
MYSVCDLGAIGCLIVSFQRYVPSNGHLFTEKLSLEGAHGGLERSNAAHNDGG